MKTNTIITLENELRLTLIRADEVPEPGTFLSAGELAKLASLKIEKRRRDWLGGRYAAKTLLKESLALTTQLSAIEISYDSFGRPVWTDRLISITHSGPFCAAACGPARTKFLGIDIEKAEPRAAAWYKDYFHKSELPSHDMEAATRLWTQKEALLKALGLGLKADPLDIKLSGDKPEFSRTALSRYKELGSPAFTLNTLTPGPGYYLSAACENSGTGASEQ
ncbi:MAG: hypothetical protein A2270_05305 [Elusimicrobia bacterium RIFOXYA12_FULL_51_18]|nr:MAG: hypothetical protein A2270_05305 [Elusimicrobia bacterium RIFOXYA12_FULL_51_18]OGS28757.1 MAG: hypothetical protein A2218_11360 [Elusimicrobia bacterium RIFOXYA2_FULL_53_38]